jgi:Fe-only nitrogenase delta subunit
MDQVMNQRMEQLLDYIMKKCLWQFHSRAWDRERQNKEILAKACEILCADPLKLDTPEDRCYWADAVCLVDAWRTRFDWLVTLSADEIRPLMQALRERLDFLTISGSLNEELTDQNY